jgi:hypothetical protein
MQPYFFPYLGYFDLINSVDRWIVFDTVQYIRHGWINRNRILHPNSAWQYITVPLKKQSRSTLIKDVEISSIQSNWKQRILGQLMHYKKHAPFFDETIFLVGECLSSNVVSLSRLNVSILQKICSKLDIQFDYNYLSEMQLELGSIEHAGDWALQISEALGATEYVNPIGGTHLFDAKNFECKGIKLTFKKIRVFEYKCGKYEFVPNLSIIDSFMWNSPTQIKEYLDSAS